MQQVFIAHPKTYRILYAIIAQDVMKLFPGMVTHNVNPERKLDVYTMDYSQFGVLAIKGIQELQPIIEEQQLVNEEQKLVNEEQKLQIATLKDQLAKLEAALAIITANKNENASNVIANTSLEQNKPNPFNKSTTIRYSSTRQQRANKHIRSNR